MKINEKDIGRRVVVNGSWGRQIFKNEPGKIVYVGDGYISVCFDEPREYFHGCQGHALKNHGWNVKSNMITFTEEENKMDMDFQEGDLVEHLLKGWQGKVIMVLTHVDVLFEDGTRGCYFKSGKSDETDSIPMIYHAGSIKIEGQKTIIDPIKPVRKKWMNVYIDRDGKPFFGCSYTSKSEAKEFACDGKRAEYITTIQLKRSTK